MLVCGNALLGAFEEVWLERSKLGRATSFLYKDRFNALLLAIGEMLPLPALLASLGFDTASAEVVISGKTDDGPEITERACIICENVDDDIGLDE